VELTPWTNFCLAFAAGASFAWRSGVVDDIKQRLKAHSVDRELAVYEDQPKNGWERFCFWLLKSYVDGIKKYSGKKRPGGYPLFRRAQLVGPTHQHLAMVIAGVAVGFVPQAYLLFFLISVFPANLYLLMVIWLTPSEQEAHAHRPAV
jgi:hypothetical protein